MARSFFLMFIAMSLIPAGDAAGKLMTAAGISPVFVSWSRFALGLVMILPFAGAPFLHLFRDWRIWFRGALLASGITSIQMALSTAPLADVFAAFFIGPIFSYVLAGVLLREPMGVLRSVMLALGFLGVLLVLRPGGQMIDGMEFALLAGLFYGAFLTASRWLAHLADPRALVVTQLAIGAVLLTPFGLTALPALDLRIGILTAISAAASMLGNLILLYAYRVAPATSLAPLIYLQLINATFLGWLIFSDVPDLLTWIGAAIIIAAGVTAARAR